MLNSVVCRYEAFFEPWFAEYADRIRPDWKDLPPHRKLWEWCAIAEALRERDMLRSGRAAIGFAVGKEPLPSLFASHGVKLLATDLGAGDETNNFEKTGVHAITLRDCHRPNLISWPAFEGLVDFTAADMRELAPFNSECADFIWSSCAMEHLGTLRAGIDFVLETVRLLKPGGVSVHTTEYNLGSNDKTLEAGPEVIYRRRDLDDLSVSLQEVGCVLAPLELQPGSHHFDLNPDKPPFNREKQAHVSLMLRGHFCTSVMLVVEKSL